MMLMLLLLHQEASCGVQVGVGLGLCHVTQIVALIGCHVDAVVKMMLMMMLLLEMEELEGVAGSSGVVTDGATRNVLMVGGFIIGGGGGGGHGVALMDLALMERGDALLEGAERVVGLRGGGRRVVDVADDADDAPLRIPDTMFSTRLFF